MRPYDRGRIILLLIRGLLSNFNRLLLQNKPFKNTVYKQAATQTQQRKQIKKADSAILHYLLVIQ